MNRLGRRDVLTGLASAGLALALPRRALSAPDAPLARLCDAIAPGAPDLPGAQQLGVAARIAPRLASLSPSVRARLDALYARVAARPALDQAALDALATTDGVALRVLADEVFACLYGSARHGGVGGAGPFRALAYP